MFKVAKSCVMSAIAVERLLTWTNRTRIGVTHHVAALIFYNITRCYDKHVAVFAVAVAPGDIIKYQSFVYGSFVWEIHVRCNKIEYGKYHKLEGICSHIGLHIGLLADGNIHNIKLIYRYITNNDDPVNTLVIFCGVYHGNSPDVKGNPPYNF